jgi:hypothetical protein
MNATFRQVLAVVLTGIWINASEIFRNGVLLNAQWVSHYRSLGLVFPSKPENGMIWIGWGFLFAISIFWTSRKFGLLQTTLLSWVTVFVLMWVSSWNMGMLPASMLLYAVPLSLLEAFVGALIAIKTAPPALG